MNEKNKNRWLGFKLWWAFFKMHNEKKIMSWLFCSRGYHKIWNGSESYTNSRKTTLKTSFLQCMNCDTLMFPTKKDKENYKKIHEGKRDVFANAIKNIIKTSKKKKTKIKEF